MRMLSFLFCGVLACESMAWGVPRQAWETIKRKTQPKESPSCVCALYIMYIYITIHNTYTLLVHCIYILCLPVCAAQDGELGLEDMKGLMKKINKK
eukprot:COSAG06_NODE_1066_length_10841_cov_14.808806_11_plen_96_part_00